MGYKSHDFYCCKCGNKGIPLPRPKGHNRERLHRKRLFCLHCGGVVNHIEVRNDKELEEFKENFEKGLYQDEEIVSDGRRAGFGQVNFS